MIDLQIETSTTCNAKCHFCPYPVYAPWRAGKTMPMDLFRRIIDEATDIPQIDNVVLNGLNEPLLDRFLTERYAYIHSKGRFKEALYTNAVYLTPKRLDELRAAGLTFLVISLNAVDAAQHERIMGLKDKFDIVCANAEYAIASGVDVEVHAVSNGDQFTAADSAAFIKRWGMKRYGGHGKVIVELNWAGENRTVRSFTPNECCVRAIAQINVLCDGRVTTCCADMLGTQVFGNLTTQTIREVYNSEAYTLFRGAHAVDNADKYQICKVCTRA
jgi:hypothetical protein